MDTWDREVRGALHSAPDWPGDPEQLWRRLAPALGERPRPRWHPRWRPRRGSWGLAAAGATVAAVGTLAALGLTRGASPAPAVPPVVQVATAVVGAPSAGTPLHFAVKVGATRDAVLVQSGRLEVRQPSGALVWQSPLPALESRRVRGPDAVRTGVDWPRAGAPGHYRAEVALRTQPGAAEPEAGVGLTEFFIPYPEGQIRLGTVAVSLPQTREAVTAVLDRVLLTGDATRLHFHLLGDALAGSFEWTLQDAAGAVMPSLHAQYRQSGHALEGEAEFEPTATATRHLVVRLHRVGVYRQEGGGSRLAVALPHTWEWDVNLEGS